MKRPHLTSAVIVLAALAIMPSSAVASDDEWKFGIGTGFFGLNIKGDQGFGTRLGPLELDTDLSTSDIQDLLDSAVGLGGYAVKGKWQLHYSAGRLKLEDSYSGKGPLGSPVSASASFTGTSAEFSAAYRFAMTGKHAWSVLGGVRYIKHEYDFGLSIDGKPPIPSVTLTRNIDQDWTDGVVGLTHGTKIGEKWGWSNRLDAGFGGSEGTYFFRTSFGWQVAKSWALGFYAQNVSIEFENGHRGDADWYLYDANEFGVGFNVLYTW